MAVETAAIAEDNSWQLTLVNPWTTIPEDWTVTLEKTENGHQVDQRCASDLADMLAACRDAGHSPVIRSSYRSQTTQQQLYANKVAQMERSGYQGQAAQDRAATIVARPGASEHQLGLAVDLVDRSYQVLDKKQETTPAQIWLMEHSWEYGFILRYPADKSEVTGIIYEPWHYRYVGKENAKAIQESGLCLEEYLEQLTQAEAAAQTSANLTAQPTQEDWQNLLNRFYTFLCSDQQTEQAWKELLEQGKLFLDRCALSQIP